MKHVPLPAGIVALLLVNLAAAELPNIVWITSEDMGPHLGCYGDNYAVTPNIDALAAKGMLYTNANSNAPVCAPARTAIISGIYPTSTGSEHMRSQTRLPADFRMLPQFLREAGYYCTNNSKEDYNLVKPGRVWDESSRNAHWRNRRDGQPFFAVFNHTTTHESQIRNTINKSHSIHDPAMARIPLYHPDTPEVRQDWAQYYDRITMMDAEVGRNLRELEDANLADDTIVFYYSDHGSGMPRNKRWLYNSGLNVPLVVYFPPKWQHLAPKGYRPGGASFRLVSFVDLAPTILSIIGTTPPEWMQGAAFAGKHQAHEPEFSFGFRGRMDERYDMARAVRDKRYLYIRNYMPHRTYGDHIAYMFATPTTRVWHQLYQDGKLNADQARFWQAKPAEELYDLERDPDEVRNLVASPEHRNVLARMRSGLREWVSRVKDLGFLSEWEIHHRSKETTPYEMAHNSKQYDFDAIFSSADLATSMQAADLPEIVKLLGHQDSAVRYWGAVGLLAQQQAGMEAGREQLVAALKDQSPMVRITAAESLGRFGSEDECERALDVLFQYTTPEANYFLSISAWNALDYLDDRALPKLDTIKSLSTETKKVPPRMGNYTALLKRKTLADLQ
jgi:arylsulfatase A-like enzyme